MIQIDGRNGGGQILRTALGLAVLTSKPFKMVNIRLARPVPGIKVQHLEAVKAVAKLCNAEVDGLEFGSKEITFKPAEIDKSRVKIKLNTAGSVGLALQAVLIAVVQKKVKVVVEGGATYGKWAVPFDSLWNVVFPMLEKFGYKVKVKHVKHGFYPKGGARVELVSNVAKFSPISILDKGKLIEAQGVSVASEMLRKASVAERQSNEVKKILPFEINMRNVYVNSLCPGSGITIWAKCENSRVGGDFVGERGVKAEKVGREAVKKLMFNYENGAVDYFTADQLMPYMALAGKSEIKTSMITEHMLNNGKTIEKFLDVKFSFDNNIIKV